MLTVDITLLCFYKNESVSIGAFLYPDNPKQNTQ